MLQRIIVIVVSTCAFFLFASLTVCAHADSQSATQHASPSPSQSSQALPWEKREQLLSAIERWHISGKIAVLSNRDSGSANVSWQRNQDRYMITIYGPFGSNSLALYGYPSHVLMIDPQGRRSTAKSAEQLLASAWGYHIPISNLNYWVRGLPVPDLPSQKRLDQRNRLVTLFQSGCVIQYLGYTRVGRVDLPNKIFISSRGFKTKLIVYEWRASSVY